MWLSLLCSCSDQYTFHRFPYEKNERVIINCKNMFLDGWVNVKASDTDQAMISLHGMAEFVANIFKQKARPFPIKH